MSKFLIKYASRGRPELFKKTIQNIIDTIGIPDFTILVCADKDDSSMNNSEIIDFCCKFGRRVFLVYGFSKTKIEAINNEMMFAPNGWNLLINMSDDFKFVLQNWGIIMQTEHEKIWGNSTDFFAHWNDGYVAENLPTMSIMGRDYYERDGYIYHPAYKSFSCDAEAMYVAMMRKRYHYFQMILFTHEHPANDKRVANDATYMRSAAHSDHDVRTYFYRLKRYFDEPGGHEILNARPELKQYL